MRLEGKVAVVTGSTRGIGEEVVRTFAAEGAGVVVTGRDSDRGAGVAREIEARGGRALYLHADMTDETAVRNLIEQTVTTFGRLDILVNNAAATDLMDVASKPLAECSTEEFDSQMRVCVYGSFWATKYALPHLVAAGGGSIIAMSSQAAVRAFPNVCSYSTAKGALGAMTRQINADYGKHGIRANTIVIGVIIHESTQAVVATPERRRSMEEIHLTKSLGQVADVAELAVYLASDQSAFLVATEIVLDGGLITRGALPRELLLAGISRNQGRE
jgi:meso-butanediol dehydrogenase / (S,S)-butanediol dehydrogenase / diacetyl reductase